eukprot:7929596-Ditylum_brightwellii.AAC.3
MHQALRDMLEPWMIHNKLTCGHAQYLNVLVNEADTMCNVIHHETIYTPILQTPGKFGIVYIIDVKKIFKVSGCFLEKHP